jgi:hypothetical protein
MAPATVLLIFTLNLNKQTLDIQLTITVACKKTYNKYLASIKDYFNCFQNNISLFSTYQFTVLEYLIQHLIRPHFDSITKRHLLFMFFQYSYVRRFKWREFVLLETVNSHCSLRFSTILSISLHYFVQ